MGNEFDQRYIDAQGTDDDIIIGDGYMAISLSEIAKRVSGILADNAVKTNHITDGAVTPVKTTGIALSSEKAQSDGLATLDESGNVPNIQLGNVSTVLNGITSGPTSDATYLMIMGV